MYYVYAYIRAKDGTPYYIGKGKNRRYKGRHPGISVPKDRSKIVFLEKNLTNIGACALERRYIRWYGRKDIGTGILYNKTDGGDGNPGAVHTSTWRKNHSEKMTGRKLSKSHVEKMKKFDKSYMKTEEYRKKMSEAKTGTVSKVKGRRGFPSNSMRVKTPYGTFSSLREAASHIGKAAVTIKAWVLSGKEGYELLN